MKISPYLVLLFSLIIFVGLGWAWQTEQGGVQTFSGEVMDDLCAKDKTHAKMMQEMKSMTCYDRLRESPRVSFWSSRCWV